VALLSSTRAALVELFLERSPMMRFRMAVHSGLFGLNKAVNIVRVSQIRSVFAMQIQKSEGRGHS
jgi:hypothetical protein